MSSVTEFHTDPHVHYRSDKFKKVSSSCLESDTIQIAKAIYVAFYVYAILQSLVLEEYTLVQYLLTTHFSN